MRLLISLCLIGGPVGLAAGHTLYDDRGLALAHELLSLHHLPALILLLLAAAILYRKVIKARRD